MPHTHTHAGLIKSIINSHPRLCVRESQRQAVSSTGTTRCSIRISYPCRSTVTPLTLCIHLLYQTDRRNRKPKSTCVLLVMTSTDAAGSGGSLRPILIVFQTESFIFIIEKPPTHTVQTLTVQN